MLAIVIGFVSDHAANGPAVCLVKFLDFLTCNPARLEFIELPPIQPESDTFSFNFVLNEFCNEFETAYPSFKFIMKYRSSEYCKLSMNSDTCDTPEKLLMPDNFSRESIGVYIAVVFIRKAATFSCFCWKAR